MDNNNFAEEKELADRIVEEFIRIAYSPEVVKRTKGLDRKYGGIGVEELYQPMNI